MGNKKLPESEKRQTVVFTTSKENLNRLDEWMQELKKENFYLSRSRFLENILLDYLEKKKTT